MFITNLIVEFVFVWCAIQKVYAMGEFPMSGLAELRDKYTSLGSELASVACLAPSPQRKYLFGLP